MKITRILPVILFAIVACGETAKEPVPVSSISVAPTTLTLTEGETSRIEATVLPENADDRTVSWASSNPSVASVEQGTVKGISAGTTTITAKAGSKSATCVVTVEPQFVGVSSVSINKTSLELVKGSSETLTATVQPINATESTVAWSSSNEAIATVSQSGEVTAIAGGSATITATAGGQSGTCRVTVSVPLTGISFVEGAGMVVDDQEAHRIRIELTPADATVSDIAWKIEDEGILAISSSEGDYIRNVQAVNNGKTNIIVSSASSNISATLPIEVKVKVTLAYIGKGTWNSAEQDYDWERIYYDYYGTFGEVFVPIVYVQPDMAYTDDGEWELVDDTIANFNDDEEIIFGQKEGVTELSVVFPYSNYKSTIYLRSQEYLYDAGIRNIQQWDETLMSFGGRIYTNVPTDQFIVNNIVFCDNGSHVVCGTAIHPEPMTMYGNDTNYVRFWTPFINMTQKYGIYAINQSEFDPFISQWYFYITYQRAPGGELKHAKLYLNPANWNADY